MRLIPRGWSGTCPIGVDGEAPPAALSVFEEDARSILSPNDSPDLPFRFRLNPYRGYMHACAYCYARPSHPYIGWGAGTDFDRKIVVKRNAPLLLRAELTRPSRKGDTPHLAVPSSQRAPTRAGAAAGRHVGHNATRDKEAPSPARRRAKPQIA